MKNEIDTAIRNPRSVGVLCGALSYCLWGILPLYWKVLKVVPAYEILSHRIVWSFLFVLAILFCTKRLGKLGIALKDRKTMILITVASLLVGANWFIYIWAVNSDHIIQTSMGYYINPLVSILLGTIFLKEKLGKGQYAAIVLASIGVVILTVQYGRVPWVALALAVTFALYGLCKKIIALESAVGLALETAVLVPVALGFLLFRHVQGAGAYGTVSVLVMALLSCSGVATATPLLLFAESAKRIELSTIGFLQYFTPTISLILGVVVFKESFTPAHMISFGFIWGGLVVYTLSQLKFIKKLSMFNRKTIQQNEVHIETRSL